MCDLVCNRNQLHYRQKMADHDEFIEDLPGNKRQKRSQAQAVQLGYDSDSEDNNHSDLDESSHDEKEQQEEDNNNVSDDDMFASDKEEEAPDVKKRGFDMDQFEKDQGLGKYDEDLNLNTAAPEDQQVPDAAEAQELIDYYNNVEDFDEDQKHLRRPKQELTMEAFNLREEAENGEFDKDMNYVRKATSDDEADEDFWMSNIKNSDIENARKAQLNQQAAAINKHKTESTEKLLFDLITILEPAETPMEALARLAPKKTRRKAKNKQEVTLEDEQTRKQTVFTLTECCTQLLNGKGVSQIYDMTREEVMRLYKRETGDQFQDKRQKRTIEDVEESEQVQQQQVQQEHQEHQEQQEQGWEYRWLDEEGGEWHGPHTAYEMAYWKDNYFDNNVEVRQVGHLQSQHVSVTQFDDEH